MFKYTPSKPEPQFIRFKTFNEREKVTIEEFDAWRLSLPESPIDLGLRAVINGSFMQQDYRIATGNRLYAQLRHKFGVEPSTKVEAEEAANKLFKKLQIDYERITDGCAKELPSINRFVGTELIASFTELVLCESYFATLRTEKVQFSQIPKLLKGIPVYELFLAKISGLGPQLSGLLLSQFNPYRAPNASSFWRRAGLDVASNGRGRGIYKNQMEARWAKRRVGEGYTIEKVVSRTYSGPRKARIVETGMKGIMQKSLRWQNVSREEFDSIPPHLRREKWVEFKSNKKQPWWDSFWYHMPDDRKKVVGKKEKREMLLWQYCPTTCPYCLAFLSMRHRLQHSENKACGGDVAWKDVSDGHRKAAARRYMAKLLLRDFWVAWRMLEGLPVTEPYEVAYLGRRPHHEPAESLRHVLDYLAEQGSVVWENRPEDRQKQIYTGPLDLDDLDLDEDEDEEVA